MNNFKQQLSRISMLMLIPFATFAQNEQTFTVSGQINGFDVAEFYIDYTSEAGDRVWDTIKVVDEKFSYTGRTTKTKYVGIWPLLTKGLNPNKSDRSRKVYFFAKPGEHIIYEGSVDGTDFNAYPTGTKLNDEHSAFLKSLLPIYAEIDKASENMKRTDPDFKEKYAKVQKISEKIKEAEIEFIKTHPSSEVAAQKLASFVQLNAIPISLARELFNTLDPAIADSPFYQVTKIRLEGIEATQPGRKVPELITSSTLDGKPFDLASLRGKYVLIDFWGTWCGPCVAEMPKVKEYQEKYKDKLTVLGIDSGDKQEKIEAFVTKNAYTWRQLMSKKGTPDDFVAKFNVNGFPTKFIIDPRGKILYRFEGNAEESFEKLDELLAN
ncbi:AhpC/TSA family protein [Flavobacteriaceae bacterium F08102]|nr:AhpC/TSA family protein [Flavobacteriaceae bacterium F08102]